MTTSETQSSPPSTTSSPPGFLPVLPLGWDRWLLWGAALLFDLALVMRLWDLDRFPFPVFDEVYFPNNARDYIDGKTVFDAHPPLGKYFIVLGILLFGRNEVGYRFFTAIFGALVILLVIGTVYRLTYRRGLALLAGLFMVSDGLFLVESRYGLMNQFLVAFGFAAQIFLLAGLERRGRGRFGLLCCSGLMLGACAAVKWNGLWFAFMFALLGTLIWAMAGYWRRFLLVGSGMFVLGIAAQTPLLKSVGLLTHPVWWILTLGVGGIAAAVWKFPRFFSQHLPSMGVLGQIRLLRWWDYVVCFMVMPTVIYVVQWIPHLWLNPQPGITLQKNLLDPFTLAFWNAFVTLHKSVLSVHTGSNLIVTVDTPVHPYCSSSLYALGQWFPDWRPFLVKGIPAAGAWSWPIMGRPVGYFFKAGTTEWFDVHAMGNPVLWWLSILAILILSVWGLRKFQAVPAYLLIGFAANYVPWFAVSRCVFIYHYMSSSAFSFMALAWLVYVMLQHRQRLWRVVGLTVVGAVILSMLYFLPIWLGFPLTPQAFYARMWFQNKIPGLTWI